MKNPFKHIFLCNRFFYAFGIVICVFVLSFPLPFLFPFALALLTLLLALTLVDAVLLFHPNIRIKARRNLPKVFSLGDENKINLSVENLSNQKLKIEVYDEIPFQFQMRDFHFSINLKSQEEKHLKYHLRPTIRGEYEFGNINLFLESILGLIQRRHIHDFPMSIPVYPSIIQMKQYELKAFKKVTSEQGIKKIRRLGHSYEFEQIKEYVRGDDYRSINWKASSRSGTLMVNQYEDERAQQVYCIIDKSRSMKLPFNDLSLLDHAINTSLVISNIALQKHDKAGLMTFSDKIGTTIKADRKANQLNQILTALYREKERPLEANYELLYRGVRNLVRGRSLILLYTNFESLYAAERVLPILRRISNLHLLVVVFFENTEILDFAQKDCDNTEDIYLQALAQKFIAEKRQIVHKLNQYGIQAVLTRPEELSVNTINKYLELKSRGLI